jgi:hypothetical protein
VSSVLPFPCPYPHRFTIDVMAQGVGQNHPDEGSAEGQVRQSWRLAATGTEKLKLQDHW